MTTMSATDHVPVLASELVELLDPREGEAALDCTFGAGGHARRIAERLGAAGSLVCIDRDPEAEASFAAFSANVECRTSFVRGDFADVIDDLASAGTGFDIGCYERQI